MVGAFFGLLMADSVVSAKRSSSNCSSYSSATRVSRSALSCCSSEAIVCCELSISDFWVLMLMSGVCGGEGWGMGVDGAVTSKNRADIDASRIGLTGISQAGWIMMLAASLCDDVSYLIADSGPTYSVAVEGHFDYLVKLKDAGFSEEDIAKARDVLERNDAITRTGEGYVELMEYVLEVRREPWFRKMGLFVNRTTAPDRIWYGKIIDFDPAPLLNELDIPILWLYGEEDKSVDPLACAAILDQLRRGNDKNYTVFNFPQANHGIHVPPNPERDALPLRVYPKELFEAKAKWLKTHVLTSR